MIERTKEVVNTKSSSLPGNPPDHILISDNEIIVVDYVERITVPQNNKIKSYWQKLSRISNEFGITFHKNRYKLS